MSTRVSRLRRLTFSTLLPTLLVSLGSLAHAKQPPKLEAEGDANAGYVTLSWSPDEDPTGAPPTYELQEDESEAFESPRVVYEGTQTSTVQSGLSDGRHFYRVRRTSGAEPGSWSPPKEFDVKHHSLALAGGLFAVGALVFALTAGFILMPRKDA